MSEQKEQIDMNLNGILENLKTEIEHYLSGSSARIEDTSIDENNVIRISINASNLLIDKHDIEVFKKYGKRHGCTMSYSLMARMRDGCLILNLYFMREQKAFTLVFYKDIIDLEVKRIQSLQSDGWGTIGYSIVVATGGPHIEIDDEGIHGFWALDEVHIGHTTLSKENFERICEYFDEIE
jgi:hypothetical protein